MTTTTRRRVCSLDDAAATVHLFCVAYPLIHERELWVLFSLTISLYLTGHMTDSKFSRWFLHRNYRFVIITFVIIFTERRGGRRQRPSGKSNMDAGKACGGLLEMSIQRLTVYGASFLNHS